MEGRSLAAAFAGRAMRSRELCWEHEGNRAIRIGKWKAVAVEPAGTWELYDLERDRTEMHNLAESQPGRLRAMIAQWEDWARRANVIPWIWKPPYGATAKEEKRT